MKTLKQWQKSGKDLEDFIQPGDWIDKGLFNYIGEIVCPYYCSRSLIQGGDPIKQEDGVLFYCTCHHTDDDRYLYLGILPEFKQ